MGRPSSLPMPALDLVRTALQKSKKPMSAYDLLGSLKKAGIKSPPIVYRALDKLMASGEIHRIERINAFVACNCAPDHRHALSVLTVCQTCDAVRELHDHAIIHQLEGLRQQGVALSPNAVIELPVRCDACTENDMVTAAEPSSSSA